MATLAFAPLPPARKRIAAVALLTCAVALTLLFTTQDVMRARLVGQPVDWSRTLRVNTLDWVLWSLLVPVIAVVGRTWRLDVAERRGVRIGVWAGLGVASTLGHSVASGVLLRSWGIRFGPPGPGLPTATFLQFWVTSTIGLNILTFLMIGAVLHAILYYRDLKARQLRETDLARRLSIAELNALRSQLQPHFLFNALHTVSSLMTSDVGRAQSVVASLGDLLRVSLDHTARQEVTLGDELSFVARYLEIQQARFGERLRVVMDATAPPGALVPSLVLQPLVENAFRHGIDAERGRGTVWIHASREGDRLRISVRDDGARVAGAATAGESGPGIGLDNIEKRLAQLYGAEHEFRVARDADGHFAVSLEFPFHTQPLPGA